MFSGNNLAKLDKKKREETYIFETNDNNCIRNRKSLIITQWNMSRKVTQIWFKWFFTPLNSKFWPKFCWSRKKLIFCIHLYLTSRIYDSSRYQICRSETINLNHFLCYFSKSMRPWQLSTTLNHNSDRKIRCLASGQRLKFEIFCAKTE